MCKHHQTCVNNLWNFSLMRDVVDTCNNSIVRLGKKTNNDNFNILKRHFVAALSKFNPNRRASILFDFDFLSFASERYKNQNQPKLRLYNFGLNVFSKCRNSFFICLQRLGEINNMNPCFFVPSVFLAHVQCTRNMLEIKRRGLIQCL